MRTGLAPLTASVRFESASWSYAWKGAAMFQRIASQRLRQLSEELATLGDQEPGPGEEKAVRFARSLSVLMRCELAERKSHDVEP